MFWAIDMWIASPVVSLMEIDFGTARRALSLRNDVGLCFGAAGVRALRSFWTLIGCTSMPKHFFYLMEHDLVGVRVCDSEDIGKEFE
jgi:hypothetical protein